MTKRRAAINHERDDEPTFDDLRVIIKEVKDFWHMGDQRIIPEARGALLRVLHNSAKRLKKKAT